MNNLILCGFMGCGKTTVGLLLARRLGREYLDLDAQIEADAGLAIPEIFARYGETHFRELEHAAVTGLAKRTNTVVSTGGGALISARNVAAIPPDDRVVFLDAPFAVCYERIRASDRPIVRRSTPDELRALFDVRRAAFLAAAGIVVDAAVPSETVVESILAKVL